MAEKLDQILVIDVESTCWESGPPPGQESDIIEIGLCMLDVATGQRRDRVSILVRPERSTVSPYCTHLTTLTQEEVEGGISLQQACCLLEKVYASKHRPWASYGDYDRKQFRRNCQARGVQYPFGDSHLNVKSLFGLTYNLGKELPLDQAMERLGFPLEGIHHRGEDDAWNIARILGHILLNARGTLAR
jgi:inhibitor of KinA sporulation pathway (predicted exonuclease)